VRSMTLHLGIYTHPEPGIVRRTSDLNLLITRIPTHFPRIVASVTPVAFLKAEPAPLFTSQRNDGVHAHGAPRRHGTSRERHDR
jgi:hypothetical protein